MRASASQNVQCLLKVLAENMSGEIAKLSWHW